MIFPKSKYTAGTGPGSPARGELYNDDPRLGDARLCGTTASLCGVESARYDRDADRLFWALRLDLMLHAYMFTLSGIPVLYSGDEIAQENDYSYHADPLKNADWTKAGKRHDPGSPEGILFNQLLRLEELRGSHRVFDGGADTWIVNTGDYGVLGIGRYYRGEKLVALFNFSEWDKTVSVDELGDFTDLITGDETDKKNIRIPSGGFAWLICDFGEEEK